MTLIGVVIAVVQLFRGVSQQKTNFEDSLTKEYREIIHRIPYKAMIGDEIDDEESYKTFNEIYNYCLRKIKIAPAKPEVFNVSRSKRLQGRFAASRLATKVADYCHFNKSN